MQTIKNTDGERMLNIALLGIGKIAGYQIEAISKVSGVQLTDAYDINPSRAKGLPPSVVFHKTLEALINRSKADIFLISTPNTTHFEIGMVLLNNGKSVLLEKPLCTNQKQLQLILDLSNKKGAFTAVAFHAAFAQDVNWWLTNNNDQYGRLIGFNCGFFDPYITQGQLSPAAKSLGGSWLDSGINALSVISRFIQPSSLQITEARMTHIKGLECQQIQGLSFFSFADQGQWGHGIIDTNWALNVDRKTTRLYYEHADILLDHSSESVFKVQGKRKTLLKDLRNENARLTNHYISLFSQLIGDYAQGTGNMDLAVPIHKLLFTAMTESEQ